MNSAPSEQEQSISKQKPAADKPAACTMGSAPIEPGKGSSGEAAPAAGTGAAPRPEARRKTPGTAPAEDRIWTRDFILGFAINFLLMTNYFVLMVVISGYAMSEYGTSMAAAGFIASVFIVGAAAARVFAGSWIERIGRRRMLAASVVVEAIASCLYFANLGPAFLVVVRVLHGFSFGVASTAIGTIVTALVPDRRKGEGVGYYMLSTTLGTAIGPFLGMALLQNAGINAVFFACAITAVVCLACMPWFKPKAPRLPLAKRTSKGLSGLVEPSAVPISLVCAVVFFGYSSVLTFLSPFAAEAGLGMAASFFFVAYAAAMAISRLFTGRLFDKRGARIVMIPAFVLIVAGMALIGLAQNGGMLMGAAALLGVGVGTVQSCGLTIAVKDVPMERLGLANSTFFILLDSGVGFGPILLGLIIPFLGYRGLYLAMAVVAVVAMVLYLVIAMPTSSAKSRQLP